ncbi:MAG: hypothetical protein AABY22_20995, partial [Nanoarchaeota archaeon]
LEIPDIDTRISLPEGNTWCRKDATICNSSGAANDPLKVLNKYGSEIQTRPCRSPEELLDLTFQIYKLFPKITFNYTSTLHTHIRVPGLREDIFSLRRLAVYAEKYVHQMFRLIDPIFEPLPKDYRSPMEYQGAMKRHQRRMVSHWYELNRHAYKAMKKAKTPEEFALAHRLSTTGQLLHPHQETRAGVNFHQLWQTDTIEFRCFTMSTDPQCLLSAFTWPILFVKAALETEESSEDILKKNKGLRFQSVFPYQYNLDWIFQLTNVRHNVGQYKGAPKRDNPRDQAKENYKELLVDGTLKKGDLE